MILRVYRQHQQHQQPCASRYKSERLREREREGPHSPRKLRARLPRRAVGQERSTNHPLAFSRASVGQETRYPSHVHRPSRASKVSARTRTIPKTNTAATTTTIITQSNTPATPVAYTQTHIHIHTVSQFVINVRRTVRTKRTARLSVTKKCVIISTVCVCVCERRLSTSTTSHCGGQHAVLSHVRGFPSSAR